MSIGAVNASKSNTGLNYQVGFFEEGGALDGTALVDRGFVKGREACYSCICACKRYVEAEDPRFGEVLSGGPEYESLAALGFGPGILEPVAVLKGNEVCNLLGLDTISAGSVISWLCECRQRGVDLGGFGEGLSLEWGNAETMLDLLAKIARREGAGDLLAQGVRKAAAVVGQGSERWAVESKGLEQSRVDTRASKAYALAFAVNPRGPDHLHAQPLAELGENDLSIALIEKLTGDAGLARPDTTEKRAEIVIWHEDVYSMVDSLGYCSFPTLSDYAVDPAIMVGLFNAATGASIDEESFLQTGRRIVTLEKCFNVRLGADRKLDRLPQRMMFEENASRPGEDNNPGELDGMLDRYYELHGWDVETSWPTGKTLDRLGLNDVRRDLEQLGKLPTSPGGEA
jgi:aldehyde:ferredoxin oxidoreductase